MELYCKQYDIIAFVGMYKIQLYIEVRMTLIRGCVTAAMILFVMYNL